jgi:hypothetical protein
MKYAITDSQGRVFRITDVETNRTTPVTDEQAAIVNADLKVLHFLLDGELLTHKQFAEATAARRLAEHHAKRIAAMTPEQRAVHLQRAAKPLRTKTKRELVDKLIELGVAAQFNALLNSPGLPLAEKLRWEASPTIAPDYPFIVENRALILGALNITSEQLDNIFR